MNSLSLITYPLSLPLTDPVLIFSLLLSIILFAPILLNKIKIPPLIGLIIAGAIIGPNGFNLMERDSSIELFGMVGLLYIMFLAGLEMDLTDFKKNGNKSLFFGLLTFIIPMGLGVIMGIYILHFSLPASMLLGSMFASHTLIAYPIVSKFGVAKNRAVNISIGGTLITDILALLVLAGISGLSTGNASPQFWIQLGISVIIFGFIVLWLFPILGRWFFKRFDDKISQYIFVLAMVFLGGFLAELAGVEAIIGAFLAGLAMNRLIPHTSPLMNRVEFVGNALFIPFFLIGVGMRIDYRAFFEDLKTIEVAALMILIATSSKFIAAWITQKSFKFSSDERHILFGLSNARVAATLAAVLVGCKIGLFDTTILNGTILMILVTCTIASFTTQKGAQNLAINDASTVEEPNSEKTENILVSVGNLETVEELIQLALVIKSKINNNLFALNVISSTNDDVEADKAARKVLTKAANVATATDNHIHELLRYDLNLVNGISSVVKEKKITDLIIGLHHKRGISDKFLGNLAEGILSKCNTTTLIYKPFQPLATIKRHLVIIPNNAEKEIGFSLWLIKIWNIARNTGAKLVFYASTSVIIYLQDINKKHPVSVDFNHFEDWNDFLILARDVKMDDNLILILSRKERPSYNNSMSKIPTYLNKYFMENNFILIYPCQEGVLEESLSSLGNPSVIQPLEKLDDLGKNIAKIFKKK